MITGRDFRRSPDNPTEDKLPKICRACPNKRRFKYCSPVCTRFRSTTAESTALELDKQDFDAITSHIHYRHRHKRW